MTTPHPAGSQPDPSDPTRAPRPAPASGTSTSSAPHPARAGIRWWPAIIIVALAAIVIGVLRGNDAVPFQQRNLQTLGALLITATLLLFWWVGFSRAPAHLRLAGLGVVIGLVGACAALFRISGVDGDLVPILEPRWARRPTAPPAAASPPVSTNPPAVQGAGTNLTSATATITESAIEPGRTAGADFPQFLGPDRTGILSGPRLEANWPQQPPKLLWRQPIGAAWSGFVIVGAKALTQEQRGEEELVTCYDAASGRLLWTQADRARYSTTIAGEGPRCTPTVHEGRVYALGATGILNCLDLETGRRLWQRQIATDAGSRVPDWGFSGSPLVAHGRVHVSAGGKPNKSLLAYRTDNGEIAWTAGGASASHASPFLATLAGQEQILMFNSRRITSHDAQSGQVLWEFPWGIGQPHVAMPIVVGSNRVVFTSGYGVGAALLEVQAAEGTNALKATQIWKSIRLKAKFSNPVARDGYIYGLDDGVMSCLDIRDGSQRWKEGRHGHGQGLWIGEHYLLMAESGELVLLRPTPDGPNEAARFPVFTDKTWNPIAVAGPLLLVRNDREAAALQLPVQPSVQQAVQQPVAR